MTNSISFHPYSETYPLLEGEEYEAFKTDIATTGVREALKYRLVKGKSRDWTDATDSGPALTWAWPARRRRSRSRTPRSRTTSTRSTCTAGT